MPIDGIGRVSGPQPTSTPLPKTAVTGPTPPPTNANGWQANTVAKTVDRTVGAPTLDPADVKATLPNPVRTGIESALKSFETRVESTLGHDAMSLARGKTPVREGDTLTEAQQTELKNASIDLVKDLPIGALAPGLASSVQSKLQAAGIDTRDVASLKLKDLGSLGGDIAKDLVKDLKANSPAAFYSLAATLGAAAGFAAYSGGSAKLASLGIKPEIKQGFFDDHLQVKIGASWDAHFKNIQPNATVSGRIDVTPNLNLSASTSFDLKGLNSAQANLSWKPTDDFSLSAGVRHDFNGNRTTANAEAAWKVNQNVDFALSASHDSRGDSRIGAGVRIRF